MSRRAHPIRFVLLIAALAAATAAMAMAIRSAWDDFSARRLADLHERNFRIAPPHHLSALIMPGDTLVVRPHDIDEALLPRLRFRLKIADAQHPSVDIHTTDYAAGQASFAFDRSGQYVLTVCVLDSATGQTVEFRKADVLVGPAIPRAGMPTAEALRRVAPSRLDQAARQTAAAAVMLVLGLIALAAFRDRLSLAWVLLLAFPVGVALWVCLSMAVMILHIRYTVWTMAAVLVAVCGLAGWRASGAGAWSARDVRRAALFVAGFLILAGVLAWFDFSMLMWDSWRYVIFGKRLAYFGKLSRAAYYPREYGVLTALTQSICPFVRLELFGIAQPLLWVCAVGFAGWDLNQRWRAADRASWLRAVLLAGLLACLATTYMAVASSVWLLSNTLAGIYLLLAMIVLQRALAGGNGLLLGVGCLFAVCFALSRIEGPITALPILLACFLVKRPDRDALRCLYVPYFLAATAWYVTLWTAVGMHGSSEFLSVPKVVLVLLANAAFLATMIAAYLRPRTDDLLRSAARFAPRLLLAVAIGVGLKNADHAAANLLSLLENLFAREYWGALWLAVCVLVLLWRGRRFDGQPMYRYVLVVMILLTFDVFLFRSSSLRVHIMDSGNRMFLHYYLLILFYLGCKFAAAQPEPEAPSMTSDTPPQPQEPPAPASPRRGWNRLTGPVILLAVLALAEGLSLLVLRYACHQTPYSDTLGETAVADPFHPYLGWVQPPNTAYDTSRRWLAGHATTSIDTDARGRSITPLHYDKPDIVIVVTGGSTVFGHGASGNPGTIPSQLEKIIYERMGVRAEVVNLGGVGYQSFQEMLRLDRYFAEERAALVLAVSGHNDAYYAAEEAGPESAFLPAHVWREIVPTVRRAEKGHVVNIGNFPLELAPHSSFFGLVRVLQQRRAEQARRNAPGEALPQPQDVDPARVRRRAQIAGGHYAAMNAIARANAAQFVMFLQPVGWTKHLTGTESARIGQQYPSQQNQVEAALLRHVQGLFYGDLRDVPKGFEFVDLSGLLDDSDQTLYVDNCHYNDEGARKIAEAILQAIRPRIQTALKQRGTRPAAD